MIEAWKRLHLATPDTAILLTVKPMPKPNLSCRRPSLRLCLEGDRHRLRQKSSIREEFTASADGLGRIQFAIAVPAGRRLIGRQDSTRVRSRRTAGSCSAVYRQCRPQKKGVAGYNAFSSANAIGPGLRHDRIHDARYPQRGSKRLDIGGPLHRLRLWKGGTVHLIRFGKGSPQLNTTMPKTPRNGTSDPMGSTHELTLFQ